MIVVEVLVALLVVSVVIVGIVKIAAPITDAFSLRLKNRFQELAPEEERRMQARLASLEEEVRGLKQLVANAQETADFAVKTVQLADASYVKLSDKRTVS